MEKPTSKRQRFAIFKRDHFTCLYCGRKPPEITLEVDHIIPRSEGGPSEDVNLVTSCFDCNRGKSNIPLDQIPNAHLDTVKLRREKLDQLKAITTTIMAEQKQREKTFEIISDKWMEAEGQDSSKWMLTGSAAMAVRRFMRQIPLDSILEAIDITMNKIGHMHLRYFCGVCWHMFRNDFADAHGEKTMGREAPLTSSSSSQPVPQSPPVIDAALTGEAGDSIPQPNVVTFPQQRVDLPQPANTTT